MRLRNQGALSQTYRSHSVPRVPGPDRMEEVVELVGDRPVDRLRQGPVDVGRRPDAGVSQPALDDLERHAGCSHDVAGGVAEAVESQTLEAGGPSGRAVDPEPEVGRPHRTAMGRLEHEAR